MLRTPYLPGESDMDQLKTIFRALGTPTEEEWPVRLLLYFSFSFQGEEGGPVCEIRNNQQNTGLLRIFFISLFRSVLSLFLNFLCFKPPQGYTKLPDYVSVGQFPKTPLRDLFTAATADTLNLLSKCIIYEPRKRISARDVRHPLFLLPPSSLSFPY